MQRIESGSLRGRRLAALPRGVEVRPTGARVRGAIFDRLREVVVGARVLDLFAGSGVLGLEALSRGAAHATFVERDPRLVQRLRAEVERFGLSGRADVRGVVVLEFLGRAPPAPFDLVLIDPPYADLDGARDAACSLVAGGFLAQGAVLVSERFKARGEVTPVRWPDQLAHDATRSYGQTVVEYLSVPSGEPST